MLFGSACRRDMHIAPRYDTFAPTDFFGDGRSERPTITDTVARGQLHLDEARYTGKVNGKDIDYFPIQITEADLKRWQGHAGGPWITPAARLPRSTTGERPCGTFL